MFLFCVITFFCRVRGVLHPWGPHKLVFVEVYVCVCILNCLFVFVCQFRERFRGGRKDLRPSSTHDNWWELLSCCDSSFCIFIERDEISTYRSSAQVQRWSFLQNPCQRPWSFIMSLSIPISCWTVVGVRQINEFVDPNLSFEVKPFGPKFSVSNILLDHYLWFMLKVLIESWIAYFIHPRLGFEDGVESLMQTSSHLSVPTRIIRCASLCPWVTRDLVRLLI